MDEMPRRDVGEGKASANGRRLLSVAILLAAALLVHYLAQSYYDPPPPVPAEAAP